MISIVNLGYENLVLNKKEKFIPKNGYEVIWFA